MIFVVRAVSSQNLQPKSPTLLLLQRSQKSIPAPFLFDQTHPAAHVIKQGLSPGFYLTQIGFFCKQEIKVQKFSKIPIKFRLGGVEACDQMEGKMKRN